MPEETSTVSDSGSTEEKPCSSTAAVADSSIDVMEEAKKLIGTGKKHLVMGDVVSAVGVFQDACGMLAAKYGDTADECGEAFFLCGKSLLELARMENSVLGNALEGVPEGSEDEEQPNNPNMESADNLDEKTRDELRKQVYDAMAEEEKNQKAVSKLEGKDGASGVKVESGFPSQNVTADLKKQPRSENDKAKSSVAESEAAAPEAGRDVSVKDIHEESVAKDKKAEENKVPEENEESSPEAEQDNEESEDEEEEDEEDNDDGGDENEAGNGQNKEEDDVGNLQLAWEMLEVAKVIYKRKESKEDQLMAAQAYLRLGEVSAESGNHPQALEDFQECLALQLKHLPPHDRLLAETHYHVAATLCYMDQYIQAIEHYNSSIKVIETRLSVLQEVIDAAEADGAKEEKNEMEELQLLLPDIREKVEDAKESQRTASAASQAIQQTLGGASTSTFLCENGGASSSTAAFQTTSQIPVKSSDSGSFSKAASDISHLVRKKRKPEEESPIKDKDAKKAKQETAINGNGDSSANSSNKVQEGKSQEPETQLSAAGSSS